MNYPSPTRIERAMSAAMQIRQILVDQGQQEDSELLHGMIEGESDVFAIIDTIAEQAIADKLLSEIAYGRGKRLKERAERCRDLILRMMGELELEKIERATYTASVGQSPGSIEITNRGEIPQYYLKSVPDTDAIKKALTDGQEVPGATITHRAMLRLLTR